MRVAALVPFKCFTRAKSRLRTRYSDSEVEAIGRAMLADVLDALAQAKTLECTTVLTDDTAVAEVAHRAGAAVRLREPDPGLNPALEQATQELTAAGFDAVLVALGDVPLLRGEDVDQVIAAGREQAVVIVPASDGGTALLFRRPPACIPTSFGPQSARAHLEASRAHGLEALRLTTLSDGVTLDLDTPEDVQKLLESEQPCRTGELLRKLRR